MKNVWLALLAFNLTCCYAQKMNLEIPAKKTLEIDIPEYKMYLATVKNNSSNQIDIKTIDKQNNEVKSGFGLSKHSKEKLMVKQNDKLSFYNSSDEEINLTVIFEEKEPKEIQNTSQNTAINFTLENKSMSSIPLIIPKVMNPNLSPMSKSGVTLDIGQEIYFKNNGKKYLLLTVDNNINEGDVLDVVSILKTRKKELNL